MHTTQWGCAANWDDCRVLLPALRATEIEEGFNSVSSCAADGMPAEGLQFPESSPNGTPVGPLPVPRRGGRGVAARENVVLYDMPPAPAEEHRLR